MKLKKILDIGAKVGGTLFPPLAAAIAVINTVLPKDKQLPESATGKEAAAAMMTLPASDRESILSQEIAAEVTKDNNFKDIVLALNEADASGASTRPQIANRAMHTLTGLSVVITLCIMWAVVTGDAEMIKNIKDLWPIVAVLLTPFAAVVKQYLGIRTHDKRARLQAAVGQPVSAPVGILNTLAALRIKGNPT